MCAGECVLMSVCAGECECVGECECAGEWVNMY